MRPAPGRPRQPRRVGPDPPGLQREQRPLATVVAGGDEADPWSLVAALRVTGAGGGDLDLGLRGAGARLGRTDTHPRPDRHDVSRDDAAPHPGLGLGVGALDQEHPAHAHGPRVMSPTHPVPRVF